MHTCEGGYTHGILYDSCLPFQEAYVDLRFECLNVGKVHYSGMVRVNSEMTRRHFSPT